MATTVSRAAAAAAPPRSFFSRGPLSWSRRSAPSTPRNSGHASSSDNWIRDKAARTSLAAPPPPPPIQRRDRAEVLGRGSLSDNWVAGKRFSVGATPAPAGRGGVYVPPPLKKKLPVDTSATLASSAAARTDLSPPKPVDTSASPAAAAAHADPSPLKPVDTSPAPAAAASSDPSLPAPVDGFPSPATHIPVIRADLQVEEPVPVATPVVGAYLEVDEPLALCTDPQVIEPLVATTTATFTGADQQVDEPVPAVTPAPDLGPNLEVEASLALCADLRVNESLLATTATPVVDANLQVEEPIPAPILGAYLEVEVEEPEPFALDANPLVNEPPIATTAAPVVGADLQVEELLTSSTVSATPAPAICAPVTKIARWDSMKIDGRASLSKSWVADKLPIARATTTSSSCGAWSGSCSKRSYALSSADDDYYAGPIFVKSPDPGSLPAPPKLMNKLFPIDTSASPAAAAHANLSLPMLLDSLPFPATPVPIVLTDLLVEEFASVATTRKDGINITGHALLSKSLVVDKLLASGATTFSSRGAWSGDCGSRSCAPSSAIDYYAGPAFFKSPDPELEAGEDGNGWEGGCQDERHRCSKKYYFPGFHPHKSGRPLLLATCKTGTARRGEAP